MDQKGKAVADDEVRTAREASTPPRPEKTASEASTQPLRENTTPEASTPPLPEEKTAPEAPPLPEKNAVKSPSAATLRRSQRMLTVTTNPFLKLGPSAGEGSTRHQRVAHAPTAPPAKPAGNCQRKLHAPPTLEKTAAAPRPKPQKEGPKTSTPPTLEKTAAPCRKTQKQPRTDRLNPEKHTLEQCFADATLFWPTKDQKYVPKVTNQLDSETCYAYSVANCASWVYYLTKGRIQSVSEQELKDRLQWVAPVNKWHKFCHIKGYPNNAENCLWYGQHWGWFTKNRYPSRPDNQTTPLEETESVNPKEGTKLVPTDYKWFENFLTMTAADKTQVQEQLFKHPILATVTGVNSKFVNWDGLGIYTEPPTVRDWVNTEAQKMNPKVALHTVVIVGFGVYNGVEYYIIQNTWGKKWGQHGYGRIAQNCVVQFGWPIDIVESEEEDAWDAQKDKALQKREKMAEKAILGFLEKKEEIPDSGKFAEEQGFDHDEIVKIIRSLNGFRLVDTQDIKRKIWVLTVEGKRYAESGSPEFQLFLAVPPEGITREDLQKKLEASVYKIGRQRALQNKWVEMGRNGNGKWVARKVPQVDDEVKNLLVRIQHGETVSLEDVDGLRRRKLITQQEWRGYSVTKGPKYVPKRKKVATDLTRENLSNWKELEFKEYNFNAKGQPLEGGYLHPLLKVRQRVQVIFQLMGFEEMQTNNYVESSFYNFDALFQPQQHPARDSHDTFFLKVPSATKRLPEDYVEKVKSVHEKGGYGSRGYHYDWSREESNKNLLRTHTTAVSSRMLYQLAQEPFTPKRYYSIDRVFRNEAVDRTHLAEFHQIEGIMCDRGLSLSDLIGVLEDFLSRLGMTKLKFKPAYNPYTEPSMEIFSYHEGLKKWVEIGNSGMFRPEMLGPMGFPEDVRVITWGLSLERLTMILNGIDDIRDLFGHKVDLGLIKRNPICRLGLAQ